MGVWARLHTASALTLLPVLALAPVAGGVLLAAWLASTRPQRPPASRDAALVLTAAVALISVWHGIFGEASWAAVVWPLLLGAALAVAITRLEAVAHRAAAVTAGLGAAGTALVFAISALVEAAGSGFDQVGSAGLHPSGTAALALALVAGSALAWRGGWPERLLGTAGVAAALVLLVLTGSRVGLAGLAAMTAALGLLVAGRLLARAHRPRSGTLVVAGGVVALLIGAQAMLMAPERLAPWWLPSWERVIVTNEVETVDDAAGAAADGARGIALLARARQLQDPLGASGGRLAAWKLAREMIAQRPLLGYGFDAIERVYAPGAASELSAALAHPHHGVLTMMLQGGTLLAVAVLTLLASLGLRLLRAALRGDVVAAVATVVLAALMAVELLHAVLRTPNVGGVVLVVMIMATAGSEASASTPAGS